MKNEINCIVLSAGKGTRMQSKDTHKVCFEIEGRPAILHSMERYSRAGLRRFTFVVGSMAEQVMKIVSSEYKGATYAYQKEALGTGNAARVGYEALGNCLTGPVMITMGDKIIEPHVIEKLVAEFEDKDLDLVFAVGPKKFNASGGHIVFDEGETKGVVESLDIQKAKLYKSILKQLENDEYVGRNPQDDIENISKNIISSERKRDKVLLQMKDIIGYINSGEKEKAVELLKKNSSIGLGNKSYEPEFLEGMKFVNSALYLFKSEAFEYGLSMMTMENADKEEYLTEAVNSICNNDRFKASVVSFTDNDSILTYNNVAELLKVKEIISGKKDECNLSIKEYKPVLEWIELFSSMPKRLHDALVDIYGEEEQVIEERRNAFLEVLNLFVKKYGSDRRVVISRAPGRINLMGRHVEHRGGNINVISIDKEMICVASPNSDEVNITNTSSDFSDHSFKIDEHFKNINWDNWLNYLESDNMVKLIYQNQGDWLNYVKASIIRLQYLYREKALIGMDMAFHGNIPVAAGLSSSSAIVVTTAEAAIALNNLDIPPQKFVDLCGEGEWFVGSRGGSGDHAAMKFAQRGNITTLGFFPFGYRGSVEFPKGYKLLIANSFVKASKTTNAKDLFNQQVAAYEFGLMMIKDLYPEYKDKLKHLRDLNPENLNVTQSQIYEILLKLPLKLNSDDLYTKISDEFHKDILRITKSHKKPEFYNIRAVMMYGVAEIRRSVKCGELLKKGDFDSFGRMMNISHDGDRVSILNDNGIMEKYEYDISDEVLNNLIDDLKSEDYMRVYRAQLEYQPGGYACSTPEIDFIVDTAKNIDGVLGAQISGAGLGGCVMILVKDEAVDVLREELQVKYYSPRELNSGITVSIPVMGSGLVQI